MGKDILGQVKICFSQYLADILHDLFLNQKFSSYMTFRVMNSKSHVCKTDFYNFSYDYQTYLWYGIYNQLDFLSIY